MDDQQLLRYSRQILLPQVGFEGQQQLARARVLVIGMGGLGVPVAVYLAAAGVGQLVISDPDRVELTNLQRQVIYRAKDLDRLKVEAAREVLEELNPDVGIITHPRRLDAVALSREIKAADAVVDASDNFATRFELNRLCVAHHTPLVSGAVIRMEGQVTVFQLNRQDSPCYRCLYQDMDEIAETCSETGVLGPVAGIIGTIQATETLKTLLDLGETLAGRLLLLDARIMEWRTVALSRDPDCPVCGGDTNATNA